MDIITQETTKENIINFAKRFAIGEQDIYIDGNSIIETPKTFFWEEREVYNHIGPMVELCKKRCGDKVTDEKIYGPCGLVMQLVPYQREYNKIRRRNLELINRTILGVAIVEDGSIDTDSLTDEGLTPGKVLVYRQGATMPKFKEDVDPRYFTSLEELSAEVLRRMHNIYNNWIEEQK